MEYRSRRHFREPRFAFPDSTWAVTRTPARLRFFFFLEQTKFHLRARASQSRIAQVSPTHYRTAKKHVDEG
jgi:hypothetical protein